MFETMIFERAARLPDRAACVEGATEFSYATMAGDIRRCIGWLKAKNLPPGSRVIIQTAFLYDHWILFFALEALGLVSVGMYPLIPIGPEVTGFLGADLILSQFPKQPGVQVAHEQIGDGWLEVTRAFWPEVVHERRRRAADPICIVLSSGTTGTPKKVLLDRAMLDGRLGHVMQLNFSVDPIPRLLSAIPIVTATGMAAAFGVWMLDGALCNRVGDMSWPEALVSMRINVLSAAPRHYEEILASLPEGFAIDIALATGGGHMSKALVGTCQRRLGSNMMVGYGTTETSAITQSPVELLKGMEDSAGYVLPWVEVSLVDEAGRPVAFGDVGEVRVRGGDVISGYLDDEAQNAISFRDGWYHPGDVATLDADGVLRVVGRTDDLMNFGGLKRLPFDYERLFLQAQPASDAAAFAAVDPATGELALWMTYVAESELSLEVLRDLAPEVPVRQARVAAIPRNFMGKVERAALRRQAEAGALTGVS